MNKKQFVYRVLAAMVIAAWGGGCVQEEAPWEETAGEVEAVVLPEQSGELAAIAGAEQATLFEEGLPGEAFDESTVDSDPGTEAGCALVEYCDAPGAKTAVCTRTGGCSCGSAWTECRTDVRYVCGALPSGPIFMNGCGWEW
jgi:hypothetical protein